MKRRNTNVQNKHKHTHTSNSIPGTRCLFDGIFYTAFDSVSNHMLYSKRMSQNFKKNETIEILY